MCKDAKPLIRFKLKRPGTATAASDSLCDVFSVFVTFTAPLTQKAVELSPLEKAALRSELIYRITIVNNRHREMTQKRPSFRGLVRLSGAYFFLL
jgi:hypothetical protein